jgi:hypothetical protein
LLREKDFFIFACLKKVNHSIMKKIFTLVLAAMAFVYAANAQNFTVYFGMDMSNYTDPISPFGVRVAGDFVPRGASVNGTAIQGWSPSDTTGTLTNLGNNKWGIAITFPDSQLGQTLTFKFVNGNNWGMNEGAATLTACGIDDGFGGFNRQYLLEGTAYITYCWNECTRCDGSDPVSAASVKSNSVTLNKIYPNPFSGSTRVDLNVVQSGSLKVRVYNILGQPVATLFDGFAGAGSLSLNWDGTTQTGELAREGAYLIRVEMGQNATTHRVLLNR